MRRRLWVGRRTFRGDLRGWEGREEEVEEEEVEEEEVEEEEYQHYHSITADVEDGGEGEGEQAPNTDSPSQVFSQQ